MDKTAEKLYALIKYCDGISYSGLCAATTVDSGRIGALLRYYTLPTSRFRIPLLCGKTQVWTRHQNKLH